MPIHFVDDPEPMRLVNESPFALLVAMLLDQQFSISAAFNGPNKLAARLPEGALLTCETIATMDLDRLVAIASEKPAIHRFPRAMAGRIHDMARHVAHEYDGDAAAIWEGQGEAATVAERLAAVPGFGPEKVRITIAVLVKRFGHDFEGWQEAAAPFGDDQPRSVADIGSPIDFERVKAWKKAQKAAGLAKDD